MRREDRGRKASSLVRPRVASMEGYVAGEQPGEGEFVKLNSNENPYLPSPRVRDSIHEASERLVAYPEASAETLRRIAGERWGLDPDGIVVGNGSDELLTVLMRAVVDAGQAVAFPVPTYSLYTTLADLQAARALTIPYAANWELPREIEAVDARLLLICNPNSPSGTAISRERIRALLEAQADAVVVVDEAYADFATENMLDLVGHYENLVVVRTLSKSYSLAGLRVGFALTTPALARELHKVRDSYNLSRLAQAGGAAALRDQESFESHRAQVLESRERLTLALRQRGYEVPDSEANFVLASSPGKSLEGLAGALREAKVLVRWFASVPDAIRVTVGTEKEIEAFLQALDAI